jgi:hypothetical protein
MSTRPLVRPVEWAAWRAPVKGTNKMYGRGGDCETPRRSLSAERGSGLPVCAALHGVVP